MWTCVELLASVCFLVQSHPRALHSEGTIVVPVWIRSYSLSFRRPRRDGWFTSLSLVHCGAHARPHFLPFCNTSFFPTRGVATVLRLRLSVWTFVHIPHEFELVFTCYFPIKLCSCFPVFPHPCEDSFPTCGVATCASQMYT